MKSFIKKHRSLFAVLTALVLLFAPWLESVSFAAPNPPPYTLSRYMSTVSTSTLYNEGCDLGTKDANTSGTQNDLVILDFGGTKYDPTTMTYGVTLFSGAYASTSQVAAAVEAFAHGYYICTGSDSASKVRIAAGTKNQGGVVSSAHGSAWASMVNSINSNLQSNGYSSQTSAAGASDLEMSWSTPTAAKSWVDGYNSSHSYPMYDYGDAGGCPQSGSGNGSCNNGWTTNDVWYVSWGSPCAYPMPEIYTTSGSQANQWKSISLYSAVNKSGPLSFPGELTEYNACLERGGCTGINNSPTTGWNQLWNALNSDSRTAQSTFTYSSDMTWKN